MGIVGVLHVGLTVSDADRSMAFYRDNFGFALLTEREAEGGWVEQVTGLSGLQLRIVHLHREGLNLELLEFRRPPGAARARGFNDAGSAHVCFLTDDMDADFERLLRNGAERINPPQMVVGGPNDGGRVVYVKDPDGNAVEMHQLVRPWPV
jgi:catechol 2,3-dioxygenase-like lactoylglutathione lyase family enzyme